jgi:hypothetical protein
VPFTPPRSLQGFLWLHGGYRTAFPYPHIASPGADSGTSRKAGIAQLSSYPTLPYFLDDLWVYNLSAWMRRSCRRARWGKGGGGGRVVGPCACCVFKWAPGVETRFSVHRSWVWCVAVARFHPPPFHVCTCLRPWFVAVLAAQRPCCGGRFPRCRT